MNYIFAESRQTPGFKWLVMKVSEILIQESNLGVGNDSKQK
jgi:hypothetical protein